MTPQLRKYLHQPHRPCCNCAVCHTFVMTPSQLSKNSRLSVQHSPGCRPAGRPYLEDGRWWVVKAKCVCHLAKRPPDYWTVVRQEKAPPFVPIGIFELE